MTNVDIGDIINQRIDDLEKNINQQFENLEEKLRIIQEAQEKRCTIEMTNVNKRINGLEGKYDSVEDTLKNHAKSITELNSLKSNLSYILSIILLIFSIATLVSSFGK